MSAWRTSHTTLSTHTTVVTSCTYFLLTHIHMIAHILCCVQVVNTGMYLLVVHTSIQRQRHACSHAVQRQSMVVSTAAKLPSSTQESPTLNTAYQLIGRGIYRAH
jgi:hypothetical protein